MGGRAGGASGGAVAGAGGGGAGGRAGSAAHGGMGGGGGLGEPIPPDCSPLFRNGGTIGAPMSGAGKLLLADLNADGKLDLISVDTIGVAIFKNDGAGHFTAFGTYAAASTTSVAAATGDLNGDGLPDLAVAHDVPTIAGGPPELAVFLNNVTDERAFLALDRERGTRARVGYLTNQPRTAGVTLRFNY